MNSLNIRLRDKYVLVKREIVNSASGIIIPDSAKESTDAKWLVEDIGPHIEDIPVGHEIFFKAMCDFYRIDEKHVIISSDDVLAVKL